MRHFVTLFNLRYAARGLALYESLAQHSSEPFRLWALAMDYPTYHVLDRLTRHIRNLYIIHPDDVIKGPLAQVRGSRTVAEFCFTATPYVIEHVFIKSGSECVTYLDADLFFYSDPKKAFDEMNGANVGVIPHNFPDYDYDRLIPNGKYNVSFVPFKKDGIDVLNWWRERVTDRCDGSTCGDQLYLNEFPKLLGDKLHEFKNPGVYTAPWNMAIHDFSEGPKVDGQDLVFWHFHGHFRGGNGKHNPTDRDRTGGYPLKPETIKYVYEPYEKRLLEIAQDFDLPL